MIRTPRRMAGALFVALLPLVGGLLAVTPTPAVAASHAASHPASHAARDIFLGGKGTNGPAVSLDWAGYAVSAPLITSVSGSWTQPAASCPGKPTQSAAWVGIDGYASTDPTVQQVGTDADCTKKVKKVVSAPSYYAWYEMYPGPLVPLNTTTYPVAPGDQMSASVTLVGTTYQLVLVDAGRWTFSTLQSASTTPLNVSGEWIVEAPTTCTNSKCKPVKLTDFGTVNFTDVAVNGLALDVSGLTPATITMSKNKKGTKVKASTSALDPSNGFAVTWVQN